MRLSAAVHELGGEQASDPGPRTPFWLSIWLLPPPQGWETAGGHRGGWWLWAELCMLRDTKMGLKGLHCPSCVSDPRLPGGVLYPWGFQVVERPVVVLLSTNPAAALA